MNIFYDITKYHVDLESVSDDVKCIHLSYTKFFMYSHPVI